MSYPYSQPPPPYSYAPPAPPPRQTSPAVWIILGLAIVAIVGLLGTCGVIGGLAAISASHGKEGEGAVMGAQVRPTTLDALKTKKLLGKDEPLLVYYDATVSIDMSEVAFVTPDRVVHAQDGVVASFTLKDVTKITHHIEGIIGDVFEVYTADGRGLRVEIAPLCNGETFFTVLEDSWRKHVPDARIARIATK